MDKLMLVAIISMTSLAVMFAAVLAFADKKLRVVENPKIAEVNRFLPHVNCGACGYVNCHDFAEHIVNDGEDPKKCRVLGEEAREELLKFLGEEGGSAYPQVAIVHCAAEDEHKRPVADYNGIRNCRAANLVFGGGMQCEYGCMGFGDCTEVCPFDAIHMEKGLPRIDPEKCTGCGKCVQACPRGIIKLAEKRYEKLFYVACSSHDGALRVRQICPVGCIACGICEKLSKSEIFKVTDNLAEAHYVKEEKQDEVKTISAKCPTKVIKET